MFACAYTTSSSLGAHACANLHDYGALPDALQSNIADPLLQTPQLCCAQVASSCCFVLANATAVSSNHVSVTHCQ